MNECRRGFTLIELSIVLVIIGLIVGGVLTGRDLISAAAVRAQISQIEKYQSAANTFRGKYGYLPGDIPVIPATQFGLASRGSYAGEGDGNGSIEGIYAGFPNCNWGSYAFTGEQGMFWVDLTQAGLVDGAFMTATSNAPPASIVQSKVGLYFPTAKIGNGGFVYVWSGGWSGWWNGSPGDSLNYFGISTITGGFGNNDSIPLLTVAQAYGIDKKMDDGLPQTGNVMALDDSGGWASGGPIAGNPAIEELTGDYDQGGTSTGGGPITPNTANGDLFWDTASGATVAQTCYNTGIATLNNKAYPEQYNVTYPNNVNCWLSFRFQ